MRRPSLPILLALLLVLPACVTINVYFPEAAAQRAAEQFVDKVIGPAAQAPEEPPPEAPGRGPAAWLLDVIVPSAHAQEADLNIRSPQVQAIQARMRQRFSSTLRPWFEAGTIGFTQDGEIAVRDASAVGLAERANLNAAVAEENRDRRAVYREIAVANGHPEWEGQIRNAFARQWIQRAPAGWWYQGAGGGWTQK